MARTPLVLPLIFAGLVLGAAALTAGVGRSDPAPMPAETAKVIAELPAGDWRLDKAHASLIFRVDHLGFSNYTARFTRWDATLTLDPRNPAAASLTAEVDATSIETDYPDPASLDFNATLRGETWLDAARHPKMTFRSTRIEMTGPQTATIVGDLTLRGVTRPVRLEARFNGGYAHNPYDTAGARIGFSARGVLNRGDFGIDYGIPEPGSKMGVSNAVEIILETEFSLKAG